MEIKPILSALSRNKTGAVLIILQIAITLAIVSNSLYIINKRAEKINRPTGIDDENIIAVYPQGFGDDYNARYQVYSDLKMLRNIPGVIDAAPIADIPLSGGGWGQSLYTDPASSEDRTEIWSGIFISDHHAINSLGVEIIAGRNFNAEEILTFTENDAIEPKQVIISEALAKSLYPDENALGKLIWQLQEDSPPMTIIGIYKRMFNSWVNHEKIEYSLIMPVVRLQDGNDPNYLVRTEPGEKDRVMALIEEKMMKNKSRLLSVQSLSEIKARSYSNHKAMVFILIGVIALLITITGMGLVGLASFSVNRRRKQIGTRRALGARKRDILKYFLLEIWIISTIGIVIGYILAYTLSYFLVSFYQLSPLEWLYPFITILFIWFLAQLAVLAPAKRASEIDPAIATRSV